MAKATGIFGMKAYAMEGAPDNASMADYLPRWADDKGYPRELIRRLGATKQFGRMFRMIARTANLGDASTANYLASTMALPNAKTVAYVGTPQQNREVNGAFKLRLARLGFPGYAANDRTVILSPFDSGYPAYKCPILIIGGGVSGLMAAYALSKAGFLNVTVAERTDRPLGIWNRANVAKRSRNNPRHLNMNGIELEAAPGGGEEVAEFAARLQAEAAYAWKPNRGVLAVEPGNLKHRVLFPPDETSKEQHSEFYPIVINCMGLGGPRPLSDTNRMVTGVNATSGGKRWQDTLTPETAKGKSFVFIGLGNSTAEMLIQIQQLQRDGAEIDYRVLTHYPKDAVHNPEHTVVFGGKPYRVFRDLAAPDLTSWAGDLEEHNRAYFRALQEGRIQSRVRSWMVKDSAVYFEAGKDNKSAKIDQGCLYTLIGYQWPAEQYKRFGIITRNGYAAVDYDGEFQRYGLSPSGSRVRRGFFGLGPVIETPEDRNATVIPGMMFRIGDLLAGVSLRAAEWVLAKEV